MPLLALLSYHSNQRRIKESKAPQISRKSAIKYKWLQLAQRQRKWQAVLWIILRSTFGMLRSTGMLQLFAHNVDEAKGAKQARAYRPKSPRLPTKEEDSWTWGSLVIPEMDL
jgi:hypothetical protein